MYAVIRQSTRVIILYRTCSRAIALRPIKAWPGSRPSPSSSREIHPARNPALRRTGALTPSDRRSSSVVREQKHSARLSLFMGTGEPRSVKFDIGFGIIPDHLTPSWQIAEVRPTETAQVGRPQTMWPITTSLVAAKIVSRVEALVTFLQFWSIRYGVDYVFYQQGSQNRKIGCKFYFYRCFWFPACVFQN
jgi:hypothetical protein